MTAALPAPVRRYFDTRNARDFDAATAAFLPDAVVADEGGTHAGPAAIRAWMAETAAKYDDRAAVRRVVQHGAAVEVVAEVSGDFPGSPADLRFRFTLEEDRIRRLEIGS